MAGKPITLYDGGRLRRDFTYIDDIVAGVLACLDRPPPAGSPPLLFNIGNNRGERVSDLVAPAREDARPPAVVRSAPRPVADVVETCADLTAIGALRRLFARRRRSRPAFRASWIGSWRYTASGRERRLTDPAGPPR